jgi:Flagellin and related hook-associated proteins
MRINHNIAALNTYGKLSSNQATTAKSLEKLSSGLRINRAGDDAAGLAISEKMRGQIRGLDQASRNANDGISLIQTAEGALNETQSILQRMRELAVQSATDTNTDADRAEIQKEYSQLVSEIDRIGNSTEFNKRTLLDGSSGVKITAAGSGVSNLQGTADTKQGTVSLTAGNIDLATTAVVDGGSAALIAEADAGQLLNAATTIGIGGNNYSFTTSDSIQDALDAINADTASHGVTASFTSGTGLVLTAEGAGSGYSVNVTAAGTGDFAHADLVVANTAGSDATIGGDELNGSYEAAGNHIKVTSGDFKGLEFDLVADANETITIASNNSLKLQIGANANQDMSVTINDMRSSALGVDGLNLSTRQGANSALTKLDDALASVSTERAKLGAVQNRLEHTINNLGTTSENLSASESRIRDVDMAREMMEFTKNNILSQAAQAMLAQANQQPQGVLQLLQ